MDFRGPDKGHSQRQFPGENQENGFPEIALLSSPNQSPEIFTDWLHRQRPRWKAGWERVRYELHVEGPREGTHHCLPLLCSQYIPTCVYVPVVALDLDIVHKIKFIRSLVHGSRWWLMQCYEMKALHQGMLVTKGTERM